MNTDNGTNPQEGKPIYAVFRAHIEGFAEPREFCQRLTEEDFELLASKRLPRHENERPQLEARIWLDFIKNYNLNPSMKMRFDLLGKKTAENNPDRAVRAEAYQHEPDYRRAS